MKVKLKYEVTAPFKENLIRARGINNIENFLTPTEVELQSPDNFGEYKCNKAVEWIRENINKKALTVVDSDCDGYCASAILINYLKDLFPTWHIDFFIHSKKQHGLEDVVEELDISEYDLVFLPDAGSNDDIYFLKYPII